MILGFRLNDDKLFLEWVFLKLIFNRKSIGSLNFSPHTVHYCIAFNEQGSAQLFKCKITQMAME